MEIIDTFLYEVYLNNVGRYMQNPSERTGSEISEFFILMCQDCSENNILLSYAKKVN